MKHALATQELHKRLVGISKGKNHLEDLSTDG